jgi:hypothetical protein
MLARLIPVVLKMDRATAGLDIGLPAVHSALGLMVGLVVFVLAACWRMTTPTWAALSTDTLRASPDLYPIGRELVSLRIPGDGEEA